MGCATSKIDDLPAVALCRERLDFLNQALHLRYSVTDAHVAYVHSLTSIGMSLHRFFVASTTLPPPIITTTTATTTKEIPSDAIAQPQPRSSSSGHSAGSHLQFHTDSSSDDDHSDLLHLHDHHNDHHHFGDGSDSESELGSLHHDAAPSPPRGMMTMTYDAEPKPGSSYPLNPYNPYPYQNPYPYPGGYNINTNNPNVHMNFMRRHVTPSVSYEQRPGFSSETVHHFGDPAQQPPSSSSYYQVFSNNPNDYVGASGGGGGTNYGNPYMYGGNYGGPPQYVGGKGEASTSKQAAAPPPPPPPSTSAWDFLNPFESIESTYPPPYTPSSRDSREVREEEGIPELEDEDFQHEVVKEVLHGHQRLVDDSHTHRRSVGGASSSGERRSDVKKGEVKVEDEDEDEDEDDSEEGEVVAARTSTVAREENHQPMEYEVHMVDKKVVGDAGKGEQPGKGGGGSFKNVFEVVKEIQVQFERAAAAGDHVSKVLEVGKSRYQRKNPAFQVSTKMLNVITPSLPSSSRDSEGASVELDEEVQLRSLNLSASLQKLCLWEKKLLEEVKSEEKMRVLHDRKLRKLKQLDERGAEAHKVETTRGVVRSLSTKIRIAIQIVDRISDKINKVRDEELWPQLNELIQGLSRMWKAMLECHETQCYAIDAARGLDAIAFPDNPSDTHLEATLDLEHDLINWTCRFTEWVGAQRGFVRALNSWLFKCINDDPVETSDGYAPFSPGRAGAPIIFVICLQWTQSLERISETSEKEVINHMRVFATMVWHFRERDKGEMKQRMTVNKDIEKMVKHLDRQDLKIQKEMQALDKKMVIASGATDGLSLSGHVVYQSDTSSKTSLQAGLRHIFEALDRFTTDSVKAYDELLLRIDEVIRERNMVSSQP